LPVVNTAIMWWLRSARKAGELLAGVERDLGGRPEKNSSRRGTSYQEILKKVSLGHSIAHRWQKLNSIPEKKFEGFLARFKVEVDLPGESGEEFKSKMVFDLAGWYSSPFLLDKTYL